MLPLGFEGNWRLKRQANRLLPRSYKPLLGHSLNPLANRLAAHALVLVLGKHPNSDRLMYHAQAKISVAMSVVSQSVYPPPGTQFLSSNPLAGVEGNELADAEAKQAAAGNASPPHTLPALLHSSLSISASAARRTHNETLKRAAAAYLATSKRYPRLKSIDVSVPSSHFRTYSKPNAQAGKPTRSTAHGTRAPKPTPRANWGCRIATLPSLS